MSNPFLSRSAEDESALIRHYLNGLDGGCTLKPLTKWEKDFIESVADQFHHRGKLSPKQVEILTRIYEEKA